MREATARPRGRRKQACQKGAETERIGGREKISTERQMKNLRDICFKRFCTTHSFITSTVCLYRALCALNENSGRFCSRWTCSIELMSFFSLRRLLLLTFLCVPHFFFRYISGFLLFFHPLTLFLFVFRSLFLFLFLLLSLYLSLHLFPFLSFSFCANLCRTICLVHCLLLCIGF